MLSVWSQEPGEKEGPWAHNQLRGRQQQGLGPPRLPAVRPVSSPMPQGCPSPAGSSIQTLLPIQQFLSFVVLSTSVAAQVATLTHTHTHTHTAFVINHPICLHHPEACPSEPQALCFCLLPDPLKQPGSNPSSQLAPERPTCPSQSPPVQAPAGEGRLVEGELTEPTLALGLTSREGNKWSRNRS